MVQYLQTPAERILELFRRFQHSIRTCPDMYTNVYRRYPQDKLEAPIHHPGMLFGAPAVSLDSSFADV